MRTTLKFAVLISVLFFLSCKKESKELNFNVHANITRLVCYPNDSISMTFSLNSTGGKSPYFYSWNNPALFTGEGPFTVNIISNLLLDADVVDANNTSVKFKYEIIKDTIDSLKYDYRNPYAGSYECTVHYYWVVIDSSGVFHDHDSIYRDTIEVLKQMDFKHFMITNTPDAEFNFKDSSFLGPHTHGKFNKDSIEFSYFLTPVMLYSYFYKGRKIKIKSR